MLTDLSESALRASFVVHQSFQALLPILLCLLTLREAYFWNNQTVLPICFTHPSDKHAFVIYIDFDFLLWCINTNNFMAAFVGE